METIYSKIIWSELGLKDYEIHKEPAEKTEGLILGWVKDNTFEKVNEVLFDLSWIAKVVHDGYYDGQFYGLNQREEEKQYKHDDGKLQSDITIHDTSVFTTLLHVAIKTRVHPEELLFMAKILEAYYEKLPKDSCRNISQLKEGDEI